MARVSERAPGELPEALGEIQRRFATEYGPFANQAAVFAHVPAALRHLMPMLMELREEGRVPRRYIELAVVTVSRLNECEYCVGHHKPMLEVEGVPPEAAERVLDYAQVPEFDALDRLVIEYAIAVTERPQRIRDHVFERLREHFDEGQIVELTLRAALCGFFNRFNDALQIETEPELQAEHRP